MSVPIPIVGDIIHMSLYASHTPSSQVGINDFDFVVTFTAGAGATLQAMSDAFRTAVQAAWPAVNASVVILGGVKASWPSHATGKAQLSVESPDGTTTGTLGAAIAPSQTAPVVQKRTGYPGRTGKGRCFFPFPAASFIGANGELTAAATLNLAAYYASIYTAMTVTVGGDSSVLSPVLVRRKPLPLTTQFVTSTFVTGKLGTQRRRGDYGRQNPPF